MGQPLARVGYGGYRDALVRLDIPFDLTGRKRTWSYALSPSLKSANELLLGVSNFTSYPRAMYSLVSRGST